MKSPRSVLCHSELIVRNQMPVSPGWINGLTRPCFEAVYATPAAAPLTTAFEATLMIEPPFAFMNGRTARIIRVGTVRFTISTRSHSLSVKTSAAAKASITAAIFASTAIFCLLPQNQQAPFCSRARKYIPIFRNADSNYLIAFSFLDQVPSMKMKAPLIPLIDFRVINFIHINTKNLILVAEKKLRGGKANPWSAACDYGDFAISS